MARYFQIDAAGAAHGVVTFPAYYLLADGHLPDLPVDPWPAWCAACRQFVAAEHVADPDELARDVRELEYYTERPGLIPPDRHIVLSHLPDQRRRLAWRAARSSPARCLECGSTDLVSLRSQEPTDVPGVGRCVAHFRGWLDKRLPARYYTSEGVRVRPDPD